MNNEECKNYLELIERCIITERNLKFYLIFISKIRDMKIQNNIRRNVLYFIIALYVSMSPDKDKTLWILKLKTYALSNVLDYWTR